MLLRMCRLKAVVDELGERGGEGDEWEMGGRRCWIIIYLLLHTEFPQCSTVQEVTLDTGSHLPVGTK